MCVPQPSQALLHSCVHMFNSGVATTQNKTSCGKKTIKSRIKVCFCFLTMDLPRLNNDRHVRHPTSSVYTEHIGRASVSHITPLAFVFVLLINRLTFGAETEKYLRIIRMMVKICKCLGCTGTSR